MDHSQYGVTQVSAQLIPSGLITQRGSLKENDPQMSGIIGRCDFAVVGMALLG